MCGNQCSGFIYGLSIADQYIKSGMYKNILVVGSEIHSGGLDKTPRGRAVSVIFGDGAELQKLFLQLRKMKEFYQPIFIPRVNLLRN